MDVPFVLAVKNINYGNAKSFTNVISMMVKLYDKLHVKQNSRYLLFSVNLPCDARIVMPPPSH